MELSSTSVLARDALHLDVSRHFVEHQCDGEFDEGTEATKEIESFLAPADQHLTKTMQLQLSQFVRRTKEASAVNGKAARNTDTWCDLLARLPNGETSQDVVTDLLSSLFEGLSLLFSSKEGRFATREAVDCLFQAAPASFSATHQKELTLLKWSCVLPECLLYLSKFLVTLLEPEFVYYGKKNAVRAFQTGAPFHDIAKLIRCSSQLPSSEFAGDREDSSLPHSKEKNFTCRFSEAESIYPRFDQRQNFLLVCDVLKSLSPALEWNIETKVASDMQSEDSIYCTLQKPEPGCLKQAAAQGLGACLALLSGLKQFFASFVQEDFSSVPQTDCHSIVDEEWRASAPSQCLDQSWTEAALKGAELCFSLLQQGFCHVGISGQRESQLQRQSVSERLVVTSLPFICSVCSTIRRAWRVWCSSLESSLDQDVVKSRASVLSASLIHGALNQINADVKLEVGLPLPLILSFFDKNDGRIHLRSWHALNRLVVTASVKSLRFFSSPLHLALWRFAPRKGCPDKLLNAYLSASNSILTRLNKSPSSHLFLESMDKLVRLILLNFVGNSAHLGISLSHSQLLARHAGRVTGFFIRDWMILTVRALESSSYRTVYSGLKFLAGLLETTPQQMRPYAKDILYRLFLVYLTFLVEGDGGTVKPLAPLSQSFFLAERQEIESQRNKIKQAFSVCLNYLRLTSGNDIFRSLLDDLGNVVEVSGFLEQNQTKPVQQGIMNFRQQAINF